jgi:DNA polymerase/3'-5' exonuclease PolX
VIGLKFAREIADKAVEQLRPYCERIQVAGSVRRCRPEINDIEIVLIPKTRYLHEIKTLLDGWAKIKGEFPCKYTRRLLPEGIECDIFIVAHETWGLQMAIRTGPAEYSHRVLASGWAVKGYHSEGGVLYPVKYDSGATTKEASLDYSRPVYLREEEDVYKFIGLPWKDPEERR